MNEQQSKAISSALIALAKAHGNALNVAIAEVITAGQEFNAPDFGSKEWESRVHSLAFEKLRKDGKSGHEIIQLYEEATMRHKKVEEVNKNMHDDDAYMRTVTDIGVADHKEGKADFSSKEYVINVQRRAVQKLMDEGMRPTEILKQSIAAAKSRKDEQKKE